MSRPFWFTAYTTSILLAAAIALAPQHAFAATAWAALALALVGTIDIRRQH